MITDDDLAPDSAHMHALDAAVELLEALTIIRRMRRGPERQRVLRHYHRTHQRLVLAWNELSKRDPDTPPV